MSVRRAKLDDFDGFIDAAIKFHARSSYAHYRVNRPGVLHTFARCCNSAFAFAAVAENDGGIDGALLGACEPLWCVHARYATDLLFFFARPWDGVRLGRMFLEWVDSRPGVIDITMGVSAELNAERMDVLYRRIGLERIGGLFARRSAHVPLAVTGSVS